MLCFIRFVCFCVDIGGTKELYNTGTCLDQHTCMFTIHMNISVKIRRSRQVPMIQET
jgi:hypothetical protein